jgi:prophage antirepressor-like protein
MSIQIFEDVAWSVKALLDEEDTPWFCGNDVAKALGYARPHKAVQDHMFEEDRCELQTLRGSRFGTPLLQGTERGSACTGSETPCNLTISKGPVLGPLLRGNEGASTYITEAGVYGLIFGSKKDEAVAFRKWVCQEVLPRLRKEYLSQQRAPLSLRSESDLHYKVVAFIRRFFPHALLVVCGGEMQDTSAKRCDAWRKGYRGGTPDILISNWHKRFRGFALELKNPRGTGALSEKQSDCLVDFRRAGYKTLVADEYDVILLELAQYFRDVRLHCDCCGRPFKTAQTLLQHATRFHRQTKVCW